jgi:hypothetical protein
VLVLVNKAWAEVVAPVLWETFTTDLVQSGQHDPGLAHPKSNIVKHTRNINVLSRPSASSLDHLPKLLANIPRGQPRSFRSATFVQPTLVDLLLLLHPNLKVLDVAGEKTLATALESPWTSGSFTNFKSVIIHIGSIASEGLQRLWNEYTKLTHLEVKPSASLKFPARSAVIHEEDLLLNPIQATLGSTKEDDSSSTDQSVKALRLVYLCLVSIVLPKDLKTMFQRIDVLAL